MVKARKEPFSLTLQMTFMAQGHFPRWENLPLGDPVVVSPVVSMPLWMPAGVVTPKSLPAPLGVGKGLPGAPRIGGFIPACPAGRIPFWTSGLAWLVGSMAPESKGWKMRPAKICGATGWNEGRKQKTKEHILRLANQPFLLRRQQVWVEMAGWRK